MLPVPLFPRFVFCRRGKTHHRRLPPVKPKLRTKSSFFHEQSVRGQQKRRHKKRNQTHLRHANSRGEQKSRCEKILEKCWQQPWRAHARVSNNKKRHTFTAPSHTDSTRDKRHTTTYVTQLSPFLLLTLKWCHREPECKSIAPSPLCTKSFAWPHSQPLRGCNRFGVHTMHTTNPQRNVRWPWTAAATVYF